MHGKTILALSLCAAASAYAATWQGNGADTLWNTAGNWDSMPGSADSLAFRKSGIVNKTATLNGSYSYVGNMHVGLGSSAASPYIIEALDPSYTLTVQDDIWLGYHEDGWLWLKSGMYSFSSKSGHALHLGEGNKTVRNFWLKVGDGGSGATLTAKWNDSVLRGGSVLVADKATLDFTGRTCGMHDTSSAYLTNSTMTAAHLQLSDTSSVAASNSVLTIDGDLYVSNGAKFSADDSTVKLINSSCVFNVANGNNSTGTVVKNGGDWDCYYLRMGLSNGSRGSFAQHGGTFRIRKEFSVGYATGSSAAFVLDGGTVTADSAVDIGRAGSASAPLSSMEIKNGGILKNAVYVHIGATSPGKLTVKDGGIYTATTAQNYGMIAGGNADGALDVAGGSVTLDGPVHIALYGAKNPAGSVSVSAGGILACDGFKVNQQSAGGTALLSLDGGTVRANKDSAEFVPAKDNLTVKVGADGGAIDANGRNIVFLRPVLEDPESTGGGMAFKGGGLVTLAAGNTYTGMTTVEVGTTVLVGSPAEIGAGLAVTLPAATPADGTYKIAGISGEGAFTQAFVDGIQPPEGCRMLLESGGKAIFCVCGQNPGHVWVGGASGNLSDASGWADRVVPVGTDCVIGSASAANLALGDVFAPASITFPADSALVTISGERALSGLSSIVNNSARHHVFACPVDASEATPSLPLGTGDYLVFDGGISLKTMPSAAGMQLAGVWNLTGDWVEPPSSTTIKGGSTVSVSGTFWDGWSIVIEQGATLRAANAIARYSTKNRFAYRNAGVFAVDGDISDTIASGATTKYSLAGLFAYGGGVTRANGLVNSASTKDNHMFRLNNSGDSSVNTIVLGSGGLSFKDCHRSNTSCYPYFQVDSGKSVVLASSADWSIAANAFRNPGTSLELLGTVTIDTSDCDDPSAGHVVRAIGKIGSGGTINVKGCGRMVFEHADNDATGGMNVQAPATAAIKPGCLSTKGPVKIASGATLELPEAGTVRLGGNLTFEDGAVFSVKAGRDGCGVLAIDSKTLSIPGSVVVKLAEGSSVGHDAKYVLTSGANLSAGDETKFALAPGVAGRLSVESGELVYTAPEYFFIKISEDGEVKVPAAWVAANRADFDAADESAAEAWLAGAGANGLPRWQSWLLNLDPAAASSVVLCRAGETQPGGGIAIGANIDVRAGSGATVTAYLDRSSDGVAWSENVAEQTLSEGGAVSFSTSLPAAETCCFFRIRVVVR